MCKIIQRNNTSKRQKIYPEVSKGDLSYMRITLLSKMGLSINVPCCYGKDLNKAKKLKSDIS